MGSGVSKIGCKREAGRHKRKTNVVDKTSIGIPTDFRHLYHIGLDSSPATEQRKGTAAATSNRIPPTEQLRKQLAEITQRLQDVHAVQQQHDNTASVSDDELVANKSSSTLEEQMYVERPKHNMSLMKCYVERKIDAQVQKSLQHAHARRRSKSCSQAQR